MSEKVEESIQKLSSILEEEKYHTMGKLINSRINDLKNLKKRLESIENIQSIKFPKGEYGKKFIRFLYDTFREQEFSTIDADRVLDSIPLKDKYETFDHWGVYDLWKLAKNYGILTITGYFTCHGIKRGKYIFTEKAIPEVEKLPSF